MLLINLFKRKSKTYKIEWFNDRSIDGANQLIEKWRNLGSEIQDLENLLWYACHDCKADLRQRKKREESFFVVLICNEHINA